MEQENENGIGNDDICAECVRNHPCSFCTFRSFVPLSSEQVDDVRDSDQSENEREVADSDNESPAVSATQANDQ